jgi:hypothetical protein
MEIQPNDFTSYAMSAEEELQAQLLTQLQVAFIQNLLAKAARDKLDIVFNPEKPLQFAQQEAYAAGQIQILRHLLDCNDLAQNLISPK